MTHALNFPRLELAPMTADEKASFFRQQLGKLAKFGVVYTGTSKTSFGTSVYGKYDDITVRISDHSTGVARSASEIHIDPCLQIEGQFTRCFRNQDALKVIF